MTTIPIRLGAAMLIAAALFAGLAPDVEAADQAALLAALEKAKIDGDVKAQVEAVKPVLKDTPKEGQNGALEKLKEKYTLAGDMLEAEEQRKHAWQISILCLAAHELTLSELFGNARIVPWQAIYDTAGSFTMEKEQKVEEVAKLAKMWAPLWENIFNEMMKEHGRQEAKGDTKAMKLYLDQMELMALAAKKSLGNEELLKKFESFKEALEKWKEMSPEQRNLKKEAEEAYLRAQHKAESKEWEPTKAVLENKAIRLFKKLGDRRGEAKCYLLYANVLEGQERYSEIFDWIEKAKAAAKEAKAAGLTAEIDDYWKTLKAKEEKGEIQLTPNPFTKHGNLGDEEFISFRPGYGQVREFRPLPQAFDNHHFWRPIDLEEGVDDKGNPKGVKQMALPGPSTFYLIKLGGDITIAHDANGAGGRPFKPGKFSPAKESVTLMVWDAAKNKNVPMRYEFLAIENAKCEIAGSQRVFPKNDAYIGLRLHSNTYRTGRLAGQKITWCDDNTNGTWNDQGTPEKGDNGMDHTFWGCDAVVVGSGRSAYATLFGSLLKVKDTYYFVSSADKSGFKMGVREYKGPMGKIKVVFNGGRGVVPQHLVVGTMTGDKRIGFINLGGEKGAVEVPTGSYFFKWGLLVKGSDPNKNDRVEMFKANYPSFKVEEGKTTEIVFGGPYTIEMPVGEENGKAELQTYKLKVYGKNGEEYRRFWNKPFLADYRVKGDNKVLVTQGKLRMYTEQDELEPAGLGIGILEYAKRVLFEGHPRAKLPFKAYFRGSHPLLGKFESEGYR